MTKIFHCFDISIHALREEGDLSSIVKLPPHIISIHALREEGDEVGGKKKAPSNISIHALREEGDPSCSSRAAGASYFYPRPPRGGRPGWGLTFDAVNEFLSTPSARRATSWLPAFWRNR